MYQILNKAWIRSPYRKKWRQRDSYQEIYKHLERTLIPGYPVVTITKTEVSAWNFIENKRYNSPLETYITVDQTFVFYFYASIKPWIRSIVRRWKTWAARQKYVRAANTIRNFYYDYVVPKIYNPHTRGNGYLRLLNSPLING